MPDQTEKKFGKIVEDSHSTRCPHDQAILSLGHGKGICICGAKVKVSTVEVRDPNYMNSLGELIPYEKKVWMEE
mgnify:FL=1